MSASFSNQACKTRPAGTLLFKLIVALSIFTEPKAIVKSSRMPVSLQWKVESE